MSEIGRKRPKSDESVRNKHPKSDESVQNETESSKSRRKSPKFDGDAFSSCDGCFVCFSGNL